MQPKPSRKLVGYVAIAAYIAEETGGKCAERTARYYVAKQKLTARKVGSTVFTDTATVDAWIRGRWKAAGKVYGAARIDAH